MNRAKRSAPGREIAGAAKLRLLGAYHASVATQLRQRHATEGSASMSSIVEELRNLLGNDVVLLPIKRGNKGPSGKDMYGWENFTAAKMQEPEYLARLNQRLEHRCSARRADEPRLTWTTMKTLSRS